MILFMILESSETKGSLPGRIFTPERFRFAFVSKTGRRKIGYPADADETYLPARDRRRARVKE
jgi:hypothetical protein